MTAREPELYVDEPACRIQFLTDAACPDDGLAGCHECWLHNGHHGGCECDCGGAA